MFGGGAGERPLFVAEQEALDQVFRDRAAVDGDDRHVRARPAALDEAGEEFLADAAFALDQHRDLRLRGASGQFDRRGQAGARADDIDRRDAFLGLALQARDLAAQRAELHDVVEGDGEPFGPDRFDQEVGRAGAHGLDRRIDAAMTGQDDDRQIRFGWCQALQHRHAVKAGHVEVEQHNIGRGRRPGGAGQQDVDGGFAILGGRCKVTHRADDLAVETALDGVVVNDKDAFGHDPPVPKRY